MDEGGEGKKKRKEKEREKGEKEKKEKIWQVGPTVNRRWYRVWMGAGEIDIEDRISMIRTEYSF
jgi:hypothetical protein